MSFPITLIPIMLRNAQRMSMPESIATNIVDSIITDDIIVKGLEKWADNWFPATPCYWPYIYCFGKRM